MTQKTSFWQNNTSNISKIMPDPSRPPASRHYTVSSLNSSDQERLRFTLKHFAENKAFAVLPEDQKKPATLARLKRNFESYRHNWRHLPEQVIQRASVAGENVLPLRYAPLCVDIEVSSLCDLACPFCYRQHIATPDKIMKKDLFRKTIDQCAELHVPSVKLNWRGEPLLHPALPELIAYAKSKGILEVLINTNATGLSAKKSRELIEAGLDVLIYSFDGGTATTYNRMRPGRFRENTFEKVYGNITAFSRTRKELGASFPRTRIQMIVTRETRGEIDNFYSLFQTVVDDVSIKAYSERGGDLSRVAPTIVRRVEKHFSRKGVANFSFDPCKLWMTDGSDHLMYATGRLPCQQLLQRLIVTYDGHVHMCCYDWGGLHTIGYLSEEAFTSGEDDIKEVLAKSQRTEKGFEKLQNLKSPPPLYTPPQEVQTLSAIWNSNHLNEIRRLHLTGRVEEMVPCQSCNFRDTYQWEMIP